MKIILKGIVVGYIFSIIVGIFFLILTFNNECGYGLGVLGGPSQCSLREYILSMNGLLYDLMAILVNFWFISLLIVFLTIGFLYTLNKKSKVEKSRI